MKIDDIIMENQAFFYTLQDCPVAIIGVLNSNKGFECFQAATNRKNEDRLDVLWVSLVDEPIEDEQDVTEESRKRINDFIEKIGGKQAIFELLKDAYLSEIKDNTWLLRDIFLEAGKGEYTVQS